MMKDNRKKMLTEFLYGEVIFEGNCYGKTGRGDMKPIPSFLTWQDLGDCKKALVKKGLWNEFEEHTYQLWRLPLTKGRPFKNSTFTDWLFRPADEKGEAHFCQLVAEFMEGKGGSKT